MQESSMLKTDSITDMLEISEVYWYTHIEFNWFVVHTWSVITLTLNPHLPFPWEVGSRCNTKHVRLIHDIIEIKDHNTKDKNPFGGFLTIQPQNGGHDII